MTVIDILTRVERHGGVLAIGDDGRLVLRKPRNVPQNLRDDIRRHKVEIRAAVVAKAGTAQLAMSFPEPVSTLPRPTESERRFEIVLAEYVVLADRRQAGAA